MWLGVIETDSALLHMSPLQLLGLVKVSLSQFYLAFADSGLVPSLLETEYPVVAMDSYCPITSPLTGSTHGHLGVLLVLGSSQQVGGAGTWAGLAARSWLVLRGCDSSLLPPPRSLDSCSTMLVEGFSFVSRTP